MYWIPRDVGGDWGLLGMELRGLCTSCWPTWARFTRSRGSSGCTIRDGRILLRTPLRKMRENPGFL